MSVCNLCLCMCLCMHACRYMHTCTRTCLPNYVVGRNGRQAGMCYMYTDSVSVVARSLPQTGFASQDYVEWALNPRLPTKVKTVHLKNDFREPSGLET